MAAPKTTQEKFIQLLGLVHARLKPLGFRKRRQNFYLGSGDNFGVVDFQKSAWGSRNAIRFTVNVGIWSRRLERAFGRTVTKDLPSSLACQATERIGHWLPDSDGDKWWDLSADTDVDALSRAILSVIVEEVVPYMRARLTDEGIRDRLITRDLVSPPRGNEDLFLAELLCEIGPTDRLPEVLTRLRTLSSQSPAGFSSRIDTELRRIEEKRLR